MSNFHAKCSRATGCGAVRAVSQALQCSTVHEGFNFNGVERKGSLILQKRLAQCTKVNSGFLQSLCSKCRLSSAIYNCYKHAPPATWKSRVSSSVSSSLDNL